MSETFLENLRVLELGERMAVGLCGGLLQRLGAEVWVAEPAGAAPDPCAKLAHRSLLGAGKRSVTIDPGAPDADRTLRQLIAAADVVLTSSDWECGLGAQSHDLLRHAGIVCDVTAFGSSGPMAGHAYTDGMLQAYAGIVDTTGSPDGDPVASRIPLAECTSAVFAAAGALAAIRSRRRHGCPHRVEVAMFDVAVSMLSTFLPSHITGGSPGRIGNRHPSMSPWNAYVARDGWLLLCSASTEMWGRVCEVVGRPELKSDERFRDMPGRVRNAVAADATLQPWIEQHTVAECIDAFGKAGVPCGPVVTVQDLLRDAGKDGQHEIGVIAEGARTLYVPGALIHGAPARGRAPSAPLQPHSTGELPVKPPAPGGEAARDQAGTRVLDGVRVVEMGNYTTAPLAARNLAALGAYVVKVEPPSGELSRASPPHRDGQSYFCTMSNSDKRSVVVDLRSSEGRALFRSLLERADVFLENMKPGVLARFGFAPEDIERVNPRLVYCSISGYGAGSPLADRPAMDATIQGTAGIMDLTRGEGVPYKVGISISDLLGGQFALAAIMAALEYRSRTERGQMLNLSMQELSMWLTQFAWNDEGSLPAAAVLRCRDGYVYVEGGEVARDALVALTREQAVSMLAERGLRAAPVNSVSEVAACAQTAARQLIVERPAANGRLWPLLASPIRLEPFAVEVRRAIGAVSADLDEVRRDWNLP